MLEKFLTALGMLKMLFYKIYYGKALVFDLKQIPRVKPSFMLRVSEGGNAYLKVNLTAEIM